MMHFRVSLDIVHTHSYSKDMTGTSSMGACNSFATRQAARYITRLYERHLAAAHVTSTQFAILVLLGETPDMTMSELALAMVMDRTSLVRAIKPMERDGWLTTERAPQESRKLVLSLTKAGQNKVREALPLWQTAQQEFEAQVGSERAAQWRHDFLELTRST
jgi:DNA-binding MarR family transcriptional regulator